MRAPDVRGGLRRRWYVFVAGLLATAALAVAAFQMIGPTREIKASALLLPPANSVNGPSRREPGNPYLGLDGLDPALSVLVTKMMSKELSDRLLANASQTKYTVAEDPLSQAPIVVVTASGKSAPEAQTVLNRVMAQMPRTLTQLQDQAGIRTNVRIKVVPLVRDAKPTDVLGGLLRLEILILGAGFVATILLAGLWDALAQAAAMRRGARHAPRRRAADKGTPEDSEAPAPDRELVSADVRSSKAPLE